MQKLFLAIALFSLLLLFSSREKSLVVTRDLPLIDVQEALGADFSDKKADMNLKGVSVLVGEDIVKFGVSNRVDQRRSKRQSKHFVCTACHNIKREDPNLAFITPEARLIYTAERNMPFLQATTLYGAVNRETYYNGDYEKKYGALVQLARNDIREAIQLCATECAQGRRLKGWELESVLAYLWKLQLKVGDLSISDSEIGVIQASLEASADQEASLSLLSGKYMKESKATFLEPPADRKQGVGLMGNPRTGKLLYENSCLHCHYQKKYSFLHLDNGKMSMSYLNKRANTYHGHSIYQVIRYGTYSKYGKQSYMPHYTAEKMSEQQLADLRAYIKKRAEES